MGLVILATLLFPRTYPVWIDHTDVNCTHYPFSVLEQAWKVPNHTLGVIAFGSELQSVYQPVEEEDSNGTIICQYCEIGSTPGELG
jgi:hypothetical protein